MTAVDWNNPCERYAALNKAYFQLLSGAQEVEIRTRTLDAEEMVRFAKGDMNMLNIQLRSAENACLLSQGLPNPNRRHAIGLSYRRRGYAATYDPTDPRG